MNDYKELIEELRDFSKEIELDNQRYNIPYGIYHEETLDKAADAIEQLVKERDAAVRDLGDSDTSCEFCKHDGDKKYCKHCSTSIDLWEWRGVQE